MKYLALLLVLGCTSANAATPSAHPAKQLQEKWGLQAQVRRITDTLPSGAIVHCYVSGDYQSINCVKE